MMTYLMIVSALLIVLNVYVLIYLVAAKKRVKNEIALQLAHFSFNSKAMLTEQQQRLSINANNIARVTNNIENDFAVLEKEKRSTINDLKTTQHEFTNELAKWEDQRHLFEKINRAKLQKRKIRRKKRKAS